MRITNLCEDFFKILEPIEDRGSLVEEFLDFRDGLWNHHSVLRVMEQELFLMIEMNGTDFFHELIEGMRCAIPVLKSLDHCRTNICDSVLVDGLDVLEEFNRCVCIFLPFFC